MSACTEEFLRWFVLLTIVGRRQEWISVGAGSPWMLGLSRDLMLAENSESDMGSALRLNRRLTE